MLVFSRGFNNERKIMLGAPGSRIVIVSCCSYHTAVNFYIVAAHSRIQEEELELPFWIQHVEITNNAINIICSQDGNLAIVGLLSQFNQMKSLIHRAPLFSFGTLNDVCQVAFDKNLIWYKTARGLHIMYAIRDIVFEKKDNRPLITQCPLMRQTQKCHPL